MESKQQDTAVQHLQQMQGAATVIQVSLSLAVRLHASSLPYNSRSYYRSVL